VSRKIQAQLFEFGERIHQLVRIDMHAGFMQHTGNNEVVAMKVGNRVGHHVNLKLRFALLAAVGAACGNNANNATANGVTEAADASDALPMLAPPDYCVPAALGLVDVKGTPAGAYLVHHPADVAAAEVMKTPTIVFIPGGPGSRATATATFQQWLARGHDLLKYRVVLPYAVDGNLTDETERTIAVLDEVLACYGGTERNVQLGGTSNGGRAAFALMLRHPDRFRSLLGAPGLFDGKDDGALSTALAGKFVFNGAGALDADWRPLVQATHARLLGLGVQSSYVEFPGQGHILDEKADQEPFFAFWATHAAP
jgi:predicted esterase